MKTTVFAWAVGLSLVFGCATPSGQQASAGAVSDAKQKEAESGLICEDQRVTGSNMSRRVCRKASEVEREREKTQRDIQGKNKTQVDNR
jgi:hypothetical protein